MSQREFVTWMQYRSKRGPLNPMMRVDMGIARLGALLLNAYRAANTKGPVDPSHLVKASDLIPFMDDDSEKFATEEDMKRMFGITK